MEPAPLLTHQQGAGIPFALPHMQRRPPKRPSLKRPSASPRPYNKKASKAMTCKALRASNFSWTMECWATATGGIRLTTTNTSTPIPVEDESHDGDLDYAIRDYVRTYALWHGRAKAAQHFGVSRHTLWRCLERGRLGKSLPRAVIRAVGDDPGAIAAAARAMSASRKLQRRAAANPQPLAETLEGTLRLLCAAPLATVEELSSFGRVPATTLRRRLAKLAERGLVDSVPHHLGGVVKVRV